MDAAVPFRLTGTRLGASTHRIVVEGELDLYTAPELKDELADLSREVTHVHVDLSGVTFLDSSGIAVLMSAARQLRERDGVVVLGVDDANILKLLQITGLGRFFEIRPPEEQRVLSASPSRDA